MDKPSVRRGHDGQRHRPGVRAGRLLGAARRRRPADARSGAHGDRKSLAKFVEKGKLTAADRDAALGRLSTGTALDALADADYIVEAIVEDLDAKRALFTSLDAIAKPEAILASNTSSISITVLGAATKRPGQGARHALHEPGAADDARRDDPRPGDVRRVDAHGADSARRSARRRSKRPTTPASSPTGS